MIPAAPRDAEEGFRLATVAVLTVALLWAILGNIRQANG